ELDWWQNFGDAELSTLISQVQANNLDLASSQRNLQIAQLTLRDAGFNLLPRANVSVGAGIQYQESRIDGQQSDSNASPFDAIASPSYIDVPSKPAVYTQAVADDDSRAAQVADAALTTLGTSASTYLRLLLTRDELTAAEQNVD